jgi:hypothetical protein
MAKIVSTNVPVIKPTPFKITINGAGTITPDLNGMILSNGTTYRLTATPAPGYVLESWDNNVTPTGSNIFEELTGPRTVETATFTKQNGVNDLTVNFRKANFTGKTIAGTYMGVFTPTDIQLANYTNSGKVTLTLTEKSGTIKLTGPVNFGGLPSFKLTNGIAVVSNKMGARVELTVENGNGRNMIYGTLKFKGMVIPLQLFLTKNTASSTPMSLVLQKDSNASTAPKGYSPGTLQISAKSTKLSLYLASGTTVVDSSRITEQGLIPTFAMYARNNEYVLGWLMPANGDNFGSGRVHWVSGNNVTTLTPTKQSKTVAKPSFSTVRDIMMYYTMKPSFSNGITVAQNPRTGTSLENKFVWSKSSIKTIAATPKWTGSLKNGILSGTVKDPVTGETFSYKAATIDSWNYWGYIAGSSGTHIVELNCDLSE